MLKSIFILISLLSAHLYAEGTHEFSGEVALENRFFPEEGAFGNTGRSDNTIILQPEYSYSWDQDRKVVTVIPYARASQLDDEKTIVDIREFSFVGSWENVEARVGVSKVFWGVTESLHLVDIINQTDAVQNTDGEDKLGQPMVNLTYVSEFGNFGAFLLPYFRERTFAGRDGRLRTALVPNTDNVIYSDEDEEKQLDYAFRWSHYIGALEWGLSYFKGVDREPGFIANQQTGGFQLFYGDNEQFGLDVLYVWQNWIFKGEVLKRDSQFYGNFVASVLGFEYTFTNLYQGMDVGFLYEWLYDERGVNSFVGFEDSSFVGTRIALNDEKSTELLIGAIHDHTTGDLSSLRLESSRRINTNWKWELEGNIFASERTNVVIGQISEDDYVQFSLSYFW